MSLEHMRSLKKLPLVQLNLELQIIQDVLTDKLYLKHQIETEDLDSSSERLGLEEDPVYQ